MIKATRNGSKSNLRPLIDNYIDFVANKEYRFSDGTLGRNRPQKNTLWLDDLYMGVPALAQIGKLTGDNKYFDDAVKQVPILDEPLGLASSIGGAATPVVLLRASSHLSKLRSRSPLHRQRKGVQRLRLK